MTAITKTMNPAPLTPVDEEALKYYTRATDGERMYFYIVAELRLNSIANNLPRSVNKSIERAFKSVRNEIKNGQFISAREHLIEDVTVGGSITQELYDRILKKIDDYIAISY